MRNAMAAMLDDANGKRFVFLFGHPDDEVLICGTMMLLMERGAEVHGIWVISSDFRGKGHKRESELARAMRVLRLPEKQVHLLRVPDLGIHRELDRAANLVAEIFQRVQPHAVVADAFEGGHPDHDAVNFLAYEGLRRTGITAKLYEYPLYNGTGPFHVWKWRINDFPPDGQPTLHVPLPRDVVLRKYWMMQSYPTQWMYMGPARLASCKHRLMTVGEPYRPCPADRDHTVRPHDGQLNYERWFCRWMKISFEDFAAGVIAARR